MSKLSKQCKTELLPGIYRKEIKPLQKIERTNRKIPKSKTYLTSVKNWCPQLTWKLNEAISPKIWIESKQIKTNQNQWLFLSFYI